MHFLASFCQNYVPSQVGFEVKVFEMKMKSFLILQATIIAPTAAQILATLAQEYTPFPLPDSDLISVVTASI